MSYINYYQIEQEPRIIAAGFYDQGGVWFYTWEQARPGEVYSYDLASGWNKEIIRYQAVGGVKEMPAEQFLLHGLPPVFTVRQMAEFVDGFQSAAPAGYDRATDLARMDSWATPWNWVASPEWFSMLLSPYEMGRRWAQKNMAPLMEQWGE